jgi:prepilin-type processing-associated H-X9-DG protein
MQSRAVSAVKPSVAAQNSMERLGSRTKLVQAKAVLKGSQAVNRMPGEAIVERADKLAALVKAGAVLHGSQANTAFLGLHVTVRADQAQVVDVDAEVLPSEGPTE